MVLPEFLTTREVADLLRVSRNTVDRWTAQGRLRAVRIGGVVRYRRDDIEALTSDSRPSGSAA